MLQIALARMRGRPHLQNLLHVRVIVLYECPPQLQNAFVNQKKNNKKFTSSTGKSLENEMRPMSFSVRIILLLFTSPTS